MTTGYTITVTFEMTNGSELAVRWDEARWSGSYWEPPEVDVGEFEIFIDEKEIIYDKLPKGLSKIVDEMCNNPTHHRFSYKEECNGRIYT